ncbi:porin [Undibacterium sp. Dicai25W]|uniref:porin n=1 Tax=Undibacterium sp. Dicai25W TaxID=3413034 RepID=UPI003BF04890
MKKSFLALALMSAFSGAAFAQSSVTIYGIADVGVQGLSTGSGKVAKIESGQESGSRIGFKGTEDLGNSLKANFVLEQGISMDTGASDQGGLTFGRRSIVGLSGDFGAVNLGRDKSTTFQLFDSFDPFASGMINSGNGLKGIYSIGGQSTLGVAATATAKATTTNANTRGRVSNSVFYYTPSNLGGFYGAAQYGAGEVAGDNSLGRSLGVTLGYQIDALNVAYNYYKDNAQDANLFTNAKSANTVLVNYNFGVATPVFIYQKVKTDGTSATAAVDRKIYTLGVTVPVDAAGKLLATFTQVKDNTPTALNATTTVGNAKQFAIGYQYALSKRTDLYTAFARTNQDAASKGFEGLASVAGANINEFTAGVRHQF